MSTNEYPRPTLIDSPKANQLSPIFTYGLIGVIGFLAFAMILPYFPYENKGGKRAMCLSNLKQMALGCIEYAADNDDRMPTGSRWMDLIEPLEKNENVFHDPAREEKNDYDYAFNLNASGIKCEDVKNPQDVFLIFDSELKQRNATSDISTMPNLGRHHGQNNAAYLDGHAKRYPTP